MIGNVMLTRQWTRDGAMRRYNRAEDAAIAAGFTIPPLPTLYDIAREALETERNDNGHNEGDQRN